MAAQIIDGKAVSAKVKEEVRQEIEREGLDVGLAVVIVGDDPASRVYVNNKKTACEVCGIKSYEYALPAETTEEQLMELIDALNADSKVNGILVQLPLPKHLNEEAVIARISPLKDVDAFSASNVGKIMIGNYAFLPCTPAGCMELIHSTGVDVSGKECVVIGRSNIVGKPMVEHHIEYRPEILLERFLTECAAVLYRKVYKLREVCDVSVVHVLAHAVHIFQHKLCGLYSVFLGEKLPGLLHFLHDRYVVRREMERERCVRTKQFHIVLVELRYRYFVPAADFVSQFPL